MDGLWEKVVKLFQSAEESSAQQPVIHELIQRSSADEMAYDNFKGNHVHSGLLDWIQEQFKVSEQKNQELDGGIHFLDLPSSKGFLIDFKNTNYNKSEIISFFDDLKMRVLDFGYKSYVSDTRTYPKFNYVENIERHYLKPRVSAEEMTSGIDQRFGNINIELLSRNDVIWHLKFSATIYEDHLYQKAQTFSELITRLTAR